jgi:hypothetical protein
MLIGHVCRFDNDISDESVKNEAHQQRNDGHLFADFSERTKYEIDKEQSCSRGWHLSNLLTIEAIIMPNG